LDSEQHTDADVEVSRLRDELRLSRIELAQLREEQEIDREELARARRTAERLVTLSTRLDEHLRQAARRGMRVRRLVRRFAPYLPDQGELADLDLLESSPLMDGAWYLREYPGVAGTGMTPALHYLRRGAREGKNPGPAFDAVSYRARHRDLPADANPLLHHLRAGGR
jgi:hypothetical protein